MTIPVSGFPQATLRTDSTQPRTASGNSVYLSAGTPFGSVFGSSRGKPYALFRTAADLTPSTTMFTFTAPASVGHWGFTLGDIDADQVTIGATDAAGNPIAAADLGYQTSFNYCAASPKPSGCTGSGPFTDKPTWNPATGTLTGSGSDTLGGSAWFRPAAPVKTLTFTFSRQAGAPVYQVWFAALNASVSGTVRVAPDDTPPPSTLRLLHPDGTPVLSASGAPVTATTGPDGSYAFPGVARGDYIVALDVPKGFAATGPDRRSADASSGDATHVDFVLREDVPPPQATIPPESTPEDAPVRIPLAADSTGDGIRVTGVTQPETGHVTLGPGGVAVYSPPPGFTGTVTFTFTITDVNGASFTGTVRVNVAGLPLVPVTG